MEDSTTRPLIEDVIDIESGGSPDNKSTFWSRRDYLLKQLPGLYISKYDEVDVPPFQRLTRGEKEYYEKQVAPILPVLNSKSEPPPLFDGTPRLYVSLTCPYAQRVWIARNYKGLDQIQIVPIDLQDRPAWYKQKVYPANKVPSLEHNGKVTGESLDLLDYLDNNFEGPKLIPMDPEKKDTANELLKYTDTLTKSAFIAFSKPDSEVVQESGPAFDYLENALGKFADGPFFLGQFSVVDIAYAPFVERFQIVFPRFKNYDITDGRPKLLKWIEELHKIDAYTTTKADPEKIAETYKKRLADYQKQL